MYGRWVGGDTYRSAHLCMAMKSTELNWKYIELNWKYTELSWKYTEGTELCHVLPSNASTNMGGHPCIAYMMIAQNRMAADDDC